MNPRLLGQHLASDSPFSRALAQVRVYRGLPGSKQDPKGYGAARRQIAQWRDDGVYVCDRPLQYPAGWPDCSPAGERPREKGIDVELAIDMAVMGVKKEYDVGILVSLDTDLKPALEVVADLQRAWGRPRAEVAAYKAEGQHNRRLSLGGGRQVFCHWIDQRAYTAVRDDTDYSH